MRSSSAPAASLLSIADIARHFGLPESTARFYCKRFAAHIPTAGEGRRRRYRAEALDVIAVVLAEMQKSRTAAEVDRLLSATFPRNAEIHPLPVAPIRASADAPNVDALSLPAATAVPDAAVPPSPAASPSVLHLLERQTCALEGMLQVFRLLVERLPQPSPGPEDHAALQKEVRTLRTLLEACEKNQQADMEQIRRWIGKALRGQNPA